MSKKVVSALPPRVIDRAQRFFGLLRDPLCCILAGLTLASCTTLPSQPASPPPAQPPARTPAATTRNPALAMLASHVARQERLYRIAAPLLVKNALLCRTNSRALLGFTAKNRMSYSADMIDAAKDLLSLDDRLQVMSVLEGGGAMRAGIKAGDVLLSVQDVTLPQGKNAETEAARLLAGVVSGASRLSVRVLRDGQPLTIDVPTTMACAFAIELGHVDYVNAYSDGRRILLTRGMLDFLTTDTAIAIIIAREMAHNILQHAQALQMSGTVAAVIDQLLSFKPDLSALAGSSGIKTLPPKMDEEADRLALYLLALAGYDPGAAVTTLQGLAAVNPQSVANGYTALHPLSPQRVALMTQTVAEIRQKQIAKKAVVP